MVFSAGDDRFAMAFGRLQSNPAVSSLSDQKYDANIKTARLAVPGWVFFYHKKEETGAIVPITPDSEYRWE